MVPAGRTRLGLQLHGRRGSRAHVPSISVRCVQVSTRTHLDHRSVPVVDDPGNGLYRAGPPFRPGRLLGAGHRRFNHGARAVDRRLSGAHDARRSDSCRRYSVSFLRSACLRNPWADPWIRSLAFAAGPEARHQ